MKSVTLVSAIALSLCLTIGPAWAQSVWNVTSGSWHDSGNWSPAGVPVSGTEVRIGTTVDLRSATIASADAASGLAYLGYGVDEVGAVQVENSRTWTLNNMLRVGEYGTGTLTIENSGKVNGTLGYVGYQIGATGVATVSGSGSEWVNSQGLRVGIFGHGTLNVEAGGKVRNTEGYLGTANGTGVATVTGAGSWWENTENLYVGNWNDAAYLPGLSSQGFLNVEAGGRVSNTTAFIGNQIGTTGTAVVTGAGSTWENSGALYIGFEGTGTLTVDASGKVSAPNTTVSWGGVSQGTLNLAGIAGSRGVIETAYLTEGSGNGKLNFDGGILRATSAETNFIRNFETGNLEIKAGGANVDTSSFDVTIAPGSGLTTNAFSGNGPLTKLGTGTLTLLTTNVHTGATIIEGGILQIGNAGTTGSIAASSEINVTSGAVAFNRSGTISQGTAFPSLISGAGSIRQISSGTLELTGGNTFTGQVRIHDGTLRASLIAPSGNPSSLGSGTGSILIGNSSTTGTLEYLGTSAGSVNRMIQIGSGTASGSTGGARLRNTSSNPAHTLTFTGVGGFFNNPTDTGPLPFGNTPGARSLVLGGSNTGNNTIAAIIRNNAGTLRPSIALTKQDAGTWILTGDNTYTGGTTVQGGTLQIGAGGTTGSLSPSSPLSVSLGATLVFDRSDTITQGTHFASAITGAGALRKQGSGTLVLNGTNSINGLTTVAEGRLHLAAGSLAGGVKVEAGAFLSGSGTVNGSSTILGNHSPGNSPGLGSFEDLSYGSGASVTWELIGNTASGRGTSFDGINVSDALVFTGLTLLELAFNDTGSTAC